MPTMKRGYSGPLYNPWYDWAKRKVYEKQLETIDLVLASVQFRRLEQHDAYLLTNNRRDRY